MSDEDLEHRKHRAGQAKRELTLVSAALDAMEKAAADELFASKDAETTFREALYRAVNTIRTVRRHLIETSADADVVGFIEELRRPETAA